MADLPISVGDRIVFQAATREGNPKLTRVVRGLDVRGRPLVKAHGYADFVVRLDEILGVFPRGSGL